MYILEILRAIILLVGWPLLIGGGVYIHNQAKQFNIINGKMALGTLIEILSRLILITMYSLGITATAYMFSDVHVGTLVVIPIFFTWFIAFAYLFYRAVKLSKQANAYLVHKKEIEHAKQDFLSIASHQLRTPLTTTRWTIEAALSDTSLSPTAAQSLRTLQTENSDAIDLVNHLLNVLHIDTGTIDIHKERFDVLACITETVKELTPFAASKSMTFTVSHAEPSLNVFVDKSTAKEMCRNILQNAIKHGSQGSVIAISTAYEDSRTAKIAVTNDGAKIASELIPNLFKKFNRAHRNNVEMQSEPGGLGLYISQKFAKLQGGTISCDSNDKHTTFTILIPRAH